MGLKRLQELEDMFDGIPKHEMSREFALKGHEILGELLESMMQEQKKDKENGKDVIPPCLIVMTTSGITVVGDNRSLKSVLSVALESDFGLLLQETIAQSLLSKIASGING